MTKRRISGALIVLSAFCLSIATLLFCVYANVYDRNFYNELYNRLGIARSVGMTQDDLMRATDTLLSYCQGKRTDIDVTVSVDGNPQQAFNEQEIEHMADVRALALHGQTVRDALFIAFACLLIAGFAVDRPERKRLCTSLLWGLGAGVLLMGLIGAFAAIDFDSFWTVFHKVLFANDLWLFDPSTSILINMVPEEFFSSLVMRILLWYALAMLFLAGVFAAGMWTRKKERG